MNEAVPEFRFRQDVAVESTASPIPVHVEPTVDGGDEIDLRAYVQRVWRHKWIVFAVTAVLTSGAAIYLFTRPVLYRAEAVIRVDSERAAQDPNGRTSSAPFDDRAYYNTQLEVLESPTLVRNVIRKLDIENNPKFFAGPVMRPPGFVSRPSTASASDVDPAAEAERLSPLVTLVSGMLRAQPVLESRLNVKDTRLISINFDHPDAALSAKIANGVADELVEMNLDNRLRSNTNENKYLQTNIADLRGQIRGDEERLLKYGRNYQLPTQDETQNTVVDRLMGLNRQLLEAENDRKIAEATYRASLEPGAAESYTELNTKQIADIDAKLDDLRQRRAQLLIEVTEKYPDVQEIDKQIAVLEKSAADKRSRSNSMYRTSLETKYRQALAREDAIRKSYNDQQQLTNQQNSAAIDYRIIQQTVDTNRKLLDEMQQRQKENEMLTAKSPNNIRVLDYATIPNLPLDSNRLQYLGLALLFSLTAGIGTALLRDYFDDSLHSPFEIERTLRLPALAAIPAVGNGMFARRRRINAPVMLRLRSGQTEEITAPEGGNELIMNGEVNSPLAESFRQLRTMLTMSPQVGRIKRLLVTSGHPGEGKTTTAINIATSLAQSGASVLMIDADLRNPSLHKVFGLSADEGLSDLLTGQRPFDDARDLIVGLSENLNILPAGAPLFDCAECLGSGAMSDLLRTFEPSFDHIIIDSPPIVGFADSAILAARVDGVLLIVQENRNSTESLRQTRRLLTMVGANIVGVVINKVNSAKERYGYRY